VKNLIIKDIGKFVNLDISGFIELSGNFNFDNSDGYFMKIFDWLYDFKYFNKNDNITIILRISNLNDETIKNISFIFKMIKNISSVHVDCFYHETDENIRRLVSNLEKIVSIKFNYYLV